MTDVQQQAKEEVVFSITFFLLLKIMPTLELDF